MKKIIGLITVLLIAVGVFAYLYFSNLNNSSRSNNRVLSEIPSDASLIFQFHNEQDLYEILSDNTIFDTIAGQESKKELHFLSELISQVNEVEPLLKNQLVFLSIHPNKKDSLDYLWSISIDNIQKKDEIIKYLSTIRNTKLKEIEDNNLNLIEIKSNSMETPFYIFIDEGIARGSSSKDLIHRSANKNPEKLDPEFIKTINLGIKKEENALLNLFVNYEKKMLLTPFLRKNNSSNFELFESFSGFSSLTLNFKKDALMFNGESHLKANKDSYLRLFLNQEPIKNTIKQVLPYNTANVISYGISDLNTFQRDLKELFKEQKEFEKLEDQIKKITLETGLNPERDIQKLWSKEFATLQLSTFENLAIIQLKNGTQMQFFLEVLSSPYADNIRKMNFSDLFYFYWGAPLKKYDKPFYVIQDNLLILANSPRTLQRYLNDYNSNRFLVKNDSFTQFDQFVTDQSNVSFFMHFNNSASLLQDILKRNYALNFENNKPGIKDLYAFSFQLVSNKKHFFTNIYTGYKLSTNQESILIVDSLDTN